MTAIFARMRAITSKARAVRGGGAVQGCSTGSCDAGWEPQSIDKYTMAGIVVPVTA